MNFLTLTEAEQRLISSIVAGDYTDALNATADGLRTEHFSSPEGRALWSAVAASAMQDKSTDLAGICVRLDVSGQDFATISHLQTLEPTSARRRLFTIRVIGDAKHRAAKLSLIRASETTRAARTWEEAWEGLETELKAIQDTAADCKARSLADFVADARLALERNERPGSLSTPFVGWDKEAGRMAAGDMTVLAARPGCGKTALALMLADKTASDGKGVLFVSLEMPGEQLVARLAQQRAGRVGEITTGIHRPELEEAIEARRAALDEIAKLEKRLVIGEPKDSGSLAQIEARATLLAQAPCGLGLVVIDYLQLLQVPGDVRRESRERQVAEMSRRVKLLALNLKVPVLLLAQLNREVEKDERRPRLSDLRESGAIEQDADRVWFLYTPKQAGASQDANDVPVVICQAKARHGAPGREAELKFRRPQVRFYL
jgi:replicative DNA helicase